MKKKSDWPQQAEKETLDIKNALSRLGVAASICYVNKGPTVVRAALCIPRGVKYSQITKIADKLRCELKVLSLRIEAPIPGSKLVGIEFPRTAMAGEKQLGRFGASEIFCGAVHNMRSLS